MTTRTSLIEKIGKPSPRSMMIVEDQDAYDIINRMVIKHRACADDYDKIADSFYGGDIYDVCQRLWKFCKKNIAYYEESVEEQNVSSPQTILSRGWCDCKGYALFIGGVLDAMKREGNDIDWRFRYASYNILDATPGHVFVVVQDGENEIWVDPVISQFDYHKHYWYSEDRKVKAKASSIAGCGCTAIGTTASTGKVIMSISPVLAYVPVVGWVAAAAGEVVGFFLSTFGNKYHTSTGVRWLVQFYEHYVLNEKVGSDKQVNEADTNAAQNWFAIVLGVPVYDKYRIHALKGTDPEKGTNLNLTHEQRAAKYLTFPEVSKAGITFNDALAATYLADNLVWGAPGGAWAGALPAPATIDHSGNATTTGQINENTPVSSLAVSPSGQLVTASSTPLASNTSWIIWAAAAAALFFILKK